MTIRLPTLSDLPADPDAGTLPIARENATPAARLNDDIREVMTAMARLYRIMMTPRLMGRDLVAPAGIDDDGRSKGYVLNSTDFEGEPYRLREHLILAVYVDVANAANATLACPGIAGGTTRSEQTGGLVIGTNLEAVPADYLIPYRLYQVQWLHDSRKWLIVWGDTSTITRAIVLDRLGVPAADEDDPVGGLPWANIALPEDGIDGATDIKDRSVGGSQLALLSVGTDEIKDGAVNRRTIDAGTITGNKIADRTIRAMNIILGTLTADLFADGAVPSPAWTTEIITTTGSAVSHTITAKEVEIEIYGAGGGGGGVRETGSGGSGGAGGATTLAVDTTTTMSISGGYGGRADANVARGRSVPAPTAIPTLTGLSGLVLPRSGSGGGEGASGFYSHYHHGGDGFAGEYARLFLNKSAAVSITLEFNLGAGGSAGSGVSSRNGSAGAPARALLRYR